MPLVTITTDPELCPEGEPIEPSVALLAINETEGKAREARKLIYRLGEAFPELLTTEGSKLHLGHDTPPEAVQVDFQKFHRRAINAPVVGILIVFTEHGLTEAERLEVRDELRGRITKWFDDQAVSPAPPISLDIFWGPGHGYIAMEASEAQMGLPAMRAVNIEW